ncbi:hypothetical protein WHI96_27150 [Pseudonocardia tropica]|uniref:Uncharacterized protein n=1 Tax=Pseudonocardia tropica TaxID=681289 RepID=A0ABV1K2P4_9PSEU
MSQWPPVNLGPQRPIDDHPHPFRRDLYQHYLPRFRKHLALLAFVVVMFVWGLIGTRWNLSLSLWGAALCGLIAFVIYRVYFKDYNPTPRSDSPDNLTPEALRRKMDRQGALDQAARNYRARQAKEQGRRNY